MPDARTLIHGDAGHSCYDDDGALTCSVGKMLVSMLGPSWRELLAAADLEDAIARESK